MARPRKSQSKVTLNAKISNVDLQTIPYDGTTAFPEGAPVVFGSDGNAAAPTDAATGRATVPTEVVYVNFVDSTRTDVIDQQGNPFQDDLAALDLAGSGHLTGIRGSGIDIGLPASCWDGGVLPSVGQGVFVNNGLFAAETVPSGAAGTGTSRYYGIIERIENGRAFFYFTSRAIEADVDFTA